MIPERSEYSWALGAPRDQPIEMIPTTSPLGPHSGR